MIMISYQLFWALITMLWGIGYAVGYTRGRGMAVMVRALHGAIMHRRAVRGAAYWTGTRV